MTPAQRKVLDAYRDLTVDGVAPSFELIKQHCGFPSKNDVFRCVEALERQGHLRCPRTEGGTRMARSIEVVEPEVRIPDEMLDRLSREALWGLHARVWKRLEGASA